MSQQFLITLPQLEFGSQSLEKKLVSENIIWLVFLLVHKKTSIAISTFLTISSFEQSQSVLTPAEFKAH